MLKKINKRGDAVSLIISLVILIFVIAVISLMAGKFIPALTSILKNDSTFANNTNTVETLNLIETNAIPWLDYFFIFTFISVTIGLIISSVYIDTHPAIMIIFIIMLVLAIIFAGIFANAYNSIGESDALSSTYNQFTGTKAIFENLPLILFVIGLIVIIILYGKYKNSSGGPM